MEDSTKKVIVVHDGSFHADDVCAVAALSLVIDGPIEIVRTRDEEKIAQADFVADVGGRNDPAKNRFDHHQIGGAGKRENGIPYAAFGLVWKKFGEQLCGGASVAETVDRELVQPLDAADNGVNVVNQKYEDVAPYGFDRTINAFTSTWKETDRDVDAAFFELVQFTKALIAREIVRARAKEEARHFVEEAYNNAEDKRIIVLDAPYPSRETLAQYPEPLYFIRPRPSDGKWAVEAVRNNPRTFVNRKDLPKAWAGRRDEELAEITGVPDAVFCHGNLFMAVAKSREGAVALAKIAVEA